MEFLLLSNTNRLVFYYRVELPERFGVRNGLIMHTAFAVLFFLRSQLDDVIFCLRSSTLKRSKCSE